MTSPIAAEIRSLPPDQQLAAALAVIEDLTGADNPGIRYLTGAMGLSVGMARILWALHRASPRILSRDQLAVTVWGHGDVGDPRSIDSQVKRIRQRTGLTIRTARGLGFSLPKPLRIPTVPMGEVITAPGPVRRMRHINDRMTALIAEAQALSDEIHHLTGPEHDRTDTEPVRGPQQRNRRGRHDPDRGIHGAGHVSRG